MAKIYDVDGKKLTIKEICDELTETMKQEDKVSFGELLVEFQKEHPYEEEFKMSTSDYATMVFSHVVLDMYKFLPANTPEEERIKKLCKYLMERYMKCILSKEQTEAYQVICEELITEFHDDKKEVSRSSSSSY